MLADCEMQPGGLGLLDLAKLNALIWETKLYLKRCLRSKARVGALKHRRKWEWRQRLIEERLAKLRERRRVSFTLHTVEPVLPTMDEIMEVGPVE